MSEGAEFQRSGGGEPSEAQNLLAVELQRVMQFAHWLLRTDKASTMLVESHVNMNLMRAELIALSAKICEKLEISPDDLTKATAEELQRHLMMHQLNQKVIITPDGVMKDTNG